MTRRLIALALTVLLSGACFGQAQPSPHPTPREQARAIAADSPVEVQFLNGSHQRGLISDVSETGFVLSEEKRGRIEKSPVAFDQVKTVKAVHSVKPGHTTRNVLIGVGVGFFIFLAWVGHHT